MRRGLAYVVLAVLALAGSGAAYALLKTAYHGNDRVVLLNSGTAYTSLRDIIRQPAFKNKIVYVDVWGTTCPPCFQEFKDHTPGLTRRYRHQKDIAFLYLCIDRHPLPEMRWKSRLRELQPAGYHALIEADEEALLAREVVGEAIQGKYFPYQPFYFIIDRQGNFVRKPTANPTNGELRPSDGPRLYAKLDSLLKN